MSKTTAQRQKLRRFRLSSHGYFKPDEFWLHPDDKPFMRKLEAKMRRKRLEKAGKTPDQYCLPSLLSK